MSDEWVNGSYNDSKAMDEQHEKIFLKNANEAMNGTINDHKTMNANIMTTKQ